MDWKGHTCNGIWMNSATALTDVTAENRYLSICWNVASGHLIKRWLSLVYNHYV